MPIFIGRRISFRNAASFVPTEETLLVFIVLDMAYSLQGTIKISSEPMRKVWNFSDANAGSFQLTTHGSWFLQ
jgi:hypothetical protein